MAVVSYAFYRLPYADSYTLVESEQAPLQLGGLEELGRVPGFAVVPFHSSESSSPLLILPDSITVRRLGTTVRKTAPATETDAGHEPEPAYAAAFKAFHGAVCGGKLRKLVLARKKQLKLRLDCNLADPTAMRELFERACNMYPRLMIMLYSTPQSGTWFVASPEILLDGRGRSLHTVALAGTMPFQEGIVDWSDKNRHEQHIVEEYIEGILGQVSADVLKDGPVTMRAGNLVHLRTDFRFHLDPKLALGQLVSRLHPTPAVCGMPKQEAAAFISENEGFDRRYYSGFAGPVDLQGETHLYVALRCAELYSAADGTVASLYAGGGIVPGSECLSEWLETESKMKTIQYVLQ